jgi:hypothetical protein
LIESVSCAVGKLFHDVNGMPLCGFIREPAMCISPSEDVFQIIKCTLSQICSKLKTVCKKGTFSSIRMIFLL